MITYRTVNPRSPNVYQDLQQLSELSRLEAEHFSRHPKRKLHLQARTVEKFHSYLQNPVGVIAVAVDDSGIVGNCVLSSYSDKPEERYVGWVGALAIHPKYLGGTTAVTITKSLYGIIEEEAKIMGMNRLRAETEVNNSPTFRLMTNHLGWVEVETTTLNHLYKLPEDTENIPVFILEKELYKRKLIL